MSVVDIDRFDYSKLPPYGFIEVLGKRGTGKTTWTQYILQHTKSADTGLFSLIAGSETVRNAWSTLIHPMYIVGVDMAISHLERIRDNQNTLIRTKSKAEMEPFHMTLVLDDVASNRKIMRSPILAYLASNSRHLHMTIIILVQYHCQVVKEIRNQFDLVFVLSTGDADIVKQLHKEYCAGTTLETFRHVLGYVTEDFGMCVINNRLNSSNLSHICFYDRISSYPPDLIRLGSEEQWTFAENNYISPDTEKPSDTSIHTWENRHRVIENHKTGRLIIRKR